MNRQKYYLRTMTEKDLKIVFDWRNSDHVRLNMFHDALIPWDEHQKWFVRITGNPGNSYHIFEIHQRPVGLVCFTDIDMKNKSCFWGFYIGEPGSPKGSGLAMGFLALDHAFNNMHLRKISGECFSFNLASINYHERLGFRREGQFVEHQRREDKYEDIIRFGLLDREWLSLRSQIEAIVFAPQNQ